MERINIKRTAISDTLFKTVFKDKSILCDYVNTICRCELKEEDIVDKPIEIKKTELERGIRLDVRVQGKRGEKNTEINLEAQTKMPDLKTFNNRKIYYASSLFREGFMQGEDFSKEVYSKTIFFMLENKHLEGNPIKKIAFCEVTDEDKTLCKVYNEIEIYEIYIRNLLASNIEKDDDYSKIISEICEILVDYNFQDEKYQHSSNKTVRKVANMLSDIFGPDKVKAQAEMQRQFEAEMREVDEMMRQEGRERGLEEGRVQGKTQNQKEVANNMKNMNFELDIIAKALNITVEEVNELLKQ